MFTGIVEETGRIESFEPGPGGWRLEVAARLALEGTAIGDSIAVNGCCLTAVEVRPGGLRFDVLEESRRLTNFAELAAGSSVNLERSLAYGGKIGGHFVTGHVDAVGRIEVFEPRGADHYLRVTFPAEFARHVVRKGSIAVDGISLTIAEAEGASLAVWIIPHTLAVTALRDRRIGGAVNLEFDLLAKYVEKLHPAR